MIGLEFAAGFAAGMGSVIVAWALFVIARIYYQVEGREPVCHE
jgi:hypothetical protein